MKSKLSWIPFAILAPLAIFLKLAQGLFEEGTILGLSNLMLDYAFLAVVVLLFVCVLLLCVFDKRISPYYLPRRNYVAGITGMLLALLLAADGAYSFIKMLGSGSFDALKTVEAVLLVISAVAFVVLGLSHSFKGNEIKPISMLSIFPALLCAVRMVSCFVSFTTVSLVLADICSLGCYIFATMFFFNYSVALSLVKAKNAVKSCFIFGFPAVAALFGYSAYQLMFRFDQLDLIANIAPVELALFGVYIIAFLIEMTIYVPDKKNVRIVDDVPVLVTGKEEDTEGFIMHATGEDDDAAQQTPSSYLTTADTSDYLYEEVAPAEVTSDQSGPPDMENYLTKIDGEDDDRPQSYASRLDDIDKLILEISGKSD